MLSKDELARLREILPRLRHAATTEINDDRTDPMTDKRARMAERVEIINDAHDALDTLLRIAEAVAEAEEGFVVGQSGPDGFFPNHSGAIVQMDDPASVKGQRVRLVRIDHGRSGEGEA